jgi:hypothetical protein
MRLAGILLLMSTADQVRAITCGTGLTQINFKQSINRNLTMRWKDETGKDFDGLTNGARLGRVFVPNMIQPLLSDKIGAPFPGGELRLQNAGQTAGGQAFDILITVPRESGLYSSSLHTAYASPDGQSSMSQAAVTDAGFVCLGYKLPKSECPFTNPATGEQYSVDVSTALCPSPVDVLIREADGRFKDGFKSMKRVQQDTIMHGAAVLGRCGVRSGRT